MWHILNFQIMPSMLVLIVYMNIIAPISLFAEMKKVNVILYVLKKHSLAFTSKLLRFFISEQLFKTLVFLQ